MAERVFEVGETVVATCSHAWHITEGKQYVVTKYEPPYPAPDIGFTWPAYVTVIGDFGKSVTCHTHRFRRLEDPCSTQ